MENTPALNDALDSTAGTLPEVMPTASILKKEFEEVNTEQEKSSLQNAKVSLKKDGTPRKPYTRKDGTTAKTPPKASKGGFVGGTTPPAAGLDNSAEIAQRNELAKQCIMLVEQSGCMIAGKAAVMPDQEKIALTSNLENYMLSKNIKDMPPGLLLALGLSMYYGRVLSTPDETTKLPIYMKAVFWFKQKMYARKMNNARSHSGDNGKRENHAGEKAHSEV